MSTTPNSTSKKGLFLKLKPAQQLETIYDTLEDILVRLRDNSSLLQKIYSEIQEADFSDSEDVDSDEDLQEKEEKLPTPPPSKKKKVLPLSKTQEIPNLTQEMEF